MFTILKQKHAKKLDKLEDKLSKLEFDLADDEAEYKTRNQEELIGAGESVLSIFMVSRRTSTTTTIARRRRLTSKAKRKIDETKEDITRVKEDTTELEAELKKAVEKIVEKYDKVTENVIVKEFKPRRTDIRINPVALEWKPIWIVDYKEKGLSHRTVIED